MENALELSEAHPDSSLELPFSPHLLQRLSDLGLSVRTANCMQRENIVYIGDLVQLSESQMLKFQNLGRKSLFELKEVLNGFGLRLGMEVPGWPPENIEALSKAINRGEYNLSAETAGAPIEEEVLTDEEAAAKYTEMGLLKKVELLGLSVRSANCFHNEGIIYIGDLVVISHEVVHTC